MTHKRSSPRRSPRGRSQRRKRQEAAGVKFGTLQPTAGEGSRPTANVNRPGDVRGGLQPSLKPMNLLPNIGKFLDVFDIFKKKK